MSEHESIKFSKRVEPSGGSAIREIAKLISKNPRIISLAGGLPSPDTFPVEAFRAAIDNVLSTQGRIALQYGPTDGYAPLRELVAVRLRARGMEVQAENVLITSGSQQGLDLVGRLLVDEGTPVYVESPTYLGATQAFRAYAPAFHGIASDSDGLIVQQLVAQASRDPQAAGVVYVVPNFQNPSGRSLSVERRRELVAASHDMGLMVVEDDPYGELSFSGALLPSLYSIDPARVIYLGSLSKVLSPGIRLGFAVAPLPVIRMMEQAKQGMDLHTSQLTQMAVHRLLDGDFLDAHLQRTRSLYAQKSALMFNALKSHMPDGVRYDKATGGMFMWLALPGHIDAGEMLPHALQAEVAYVPGAPFFVSSPERNTMRLSFATASDLNIGEGIKRLSSLIRNRL